MAPNAETNDILTMTSEFSKVHSLKAAIFHTMAFKLSLEIHKNKIAKMPHRFLKSTLQRHAEKRRRKSLSSNIHESIFKDLKLPFVKRHLMLFLSSIRLSRQRISTFVPLSKKLQMLLIICYKISGIRNN